jgi:hypothetical protein
MASLVRMLTFALRSVSSRTAKIASRISSVTAGCPPPSRSQRSSAQPTSPNRRRPFSHRINVW